MADDSAGDRVQQLELFTAGADAEWDYCFGSQDYLKVSFSIYLLLFF